MRQSTPFEDLLEKDFTKQIFETKKGLAYSTGWQRVYHVFKSRNSPAGFPDWVLIRERIVYAELKREKGKPSPEQIRWLDDLVRAGGEVYLWRPSDIEEISVILGRRWGFVSHRPGPDARPPHLARHDLGPLVPRSIWIPGKGRADDAGVT